MAEENNSAAVQSSTETVTGVTPASVSDSEALLSQKSPESVNASLLGGAETEKAVEVGESDKAKTEEKVGAPEQYADFKFPDGFNPDAAAVDQFKGMAKGLNLSQEQAQGLVDWQLRETTKATQVQQQKEMNQRLAWRQQVSSSPDFQAERSYAQKTVAKFADPEARQLLTSGDSWLSDNPAIFKMLAKIGKEMVSEDRMLSGGGAGSSNIDAANVMYPNMKN